MYSICPGSQACCRSYTARQSICEGRRSHGQRDEELPEALGGHGDLRGIALDAAAPRSAPPRTTPGPPQLPSAGHLQHRVSPSSDPNEDPLTKGDPCQGTCSMWEAARSHDIWELCGRRTSADLTCKHDSSVSWQSHPPDSSHLHAAVACAQPLAMLMHACAVKTLVGPPEALTADEEGGCRGPPRHP